jgi:zinc-RING finger domain
MEISLSDKGREYNHLKNMLDKLTEKRLDDWCAICLDEMNEKEELVLTECGHLFCPPCFDQLSAANINIKCPICVAPLKKGQIRHISTKTSDVIGASEEDKAMDGNVKAEEYSQFGSKINAMIKKMRSIFAENPDAKIIMFSSFVLP